MDDEEDEYDWLNANGLCDYLQQKWEESEGSGSQDGKATVCKTVNREFNSLPDLQGLRSSTSKSGCLVSSGFPAEIRAWAPKNVAEAKRCGGCLWSIFYWVRLPTVTPWGRSASGNTLVLQTSITGSTPVVSTNFGSVTLLVSALA
jgi:hypothetical protein